MHGIVRTNGVVACVAKDPRPLNGIFKAEGWRSVKQRLLPQKYANTFRDQGCHAATSQKPGARRVEHTHQPRLPAPHQSRHSDQRIRASAVGIQQLVINPPYDSVNREPALAMSHSDFATLDAQI
jgi:hypothetical protein